MEKPKKQTRSSKSRGKQLQKHSEVEDKGANLSRSEYGLSTETDTVETKRKAPLVKQDDEPQFTETNEGSSQDEYECGQLSENKEATQYASKLLQKDKDQPKLIPNRIKVPEKIEAQKVQRERAKYDPAYTFIVVLPIFCVFAGIVVKNYFDPALADKIEIESGLRQLVKDFQGQSPYSFNKLKSRVLSYIDHKTSPQPFVLLVASTQDGQLTAKCFAQRVAQLLTAASVTINGSQYLDTTADDAKSDIDDHLRNVFQKGNFPTAAIINNLDSIPYGTTTLFYAYCDHDNPMYKEAAIIFTITLPPTYQVNNNEIDREGLVEKYLSEDSRWVRDEKYSLDVMGALISRITDTVIVVNKESRESLEKSC